MIPDVRQLFPQDNILGWILQIVYFVFFAVYMFYGQRIQTWTTLKKVENSLTRLQSMRQEGRRIAVSTIKEMGKLNEDPTGRIDRFLEYITIAPQSMDPSGVVWKLEHILDVRDTRFKEDVKIMAPEADGTQTNNLENMLEAALALNNIYKVVRHYYLLGKRTMSPYTIMQVQMQLPVIMKQAKAYTGALKAFAQGEPIGDGAGALVAAKLMHGHQKRRMAKDIIMAKVPIEDRTAYVLKAEGPGANVGKPGDAIDRIVKENEEKVSTIIIVDGAQKLQGEKTGDVAEGVGVAIGGPGVEQYKVDEAVLKQKIPVNAVIIKQDIGDAVSPMREEIFDAANDAIQGIKRLILERTTEGDSVIIAGIGNTVGIGQ